MGNGIAVGCMVVGLILVAIGVRLLLRGRRYGAIYAVLVVHPRSGRLVRWGYIGKTRQRPRERWAQHEGRSRRYRGAAQPWARTIVEWRVVKEWQKVSDFTLWWAEVWRIMVHLPLYNYQWNTHNYRRIPKYIAARQRYSARAERAIERYAGLRKRPGADRFLS